ncbi:MAG: translocation/assembly module TamB domain-containing protein, partial [Chitinophagaceae bacterium]|nr:translocation/assembly module TamB domain-containing protein [Chitinophagaceae bacterium]
LAGNASKDTLVKEKKSNKKSTFEIAIRLLDLENIHFKMNDDWQGQQMLVDLNELNLNIKTFDVLKNKFGIKELLIDGASFNMQNYHALKPKKERDKSDWGTPFNLDLISLIADNIDIKNTQFSFQEKGEEIKKGWFNPKYILAKDIDLNLKNTEIIADTIFSNMVNFSAKDESGLEVKKLNAMVKLNSKEAHLSAMNLLTPNSTLQGSFTMLSTNFHSYENFIEDVSMDLKLNKSKLSNKDIAFFAEDLRKYPIEIDIDGHVSGKVDNLIAHQLKLKSGNTNFDGSAKVVGLPDIKNTTFLVLCNNLNTSGNELNKFVPQTKVDEINWAALKQINFKGNFSGKIDDFKTKGNLRTNLGNSEMDIAMNFKNKIPKYEGIISTQNLQLGTIIKQNELGAITMSGKIQGEGFDLDHLKANLDAQVSSIIFDGKTYQQLKINGIVSNKEFDGKFISNDPTLNINFDGKLNLRGANPNFQLNSNFVRINLKKLGLTEEEIIVSANADLNFEGKNIDNFIGFANLRNITIEKGREQFFVDSFFIKSLYNSENLKELDITSNLMTASFVGDFNLSKLPKSIQGFLAHYMPQYIKMPKGEISKELFAFDIYLKNVDQLLNTIAPDIKGLSGTTLSGGLNTGKQFINFDGLIPSFGYKEYELKNIQLSGLGDINDIRVDVNTANLLYNKEALVPQIKSFISMANDTAFLKINTNSSSDIFGDAVLQCKALALNEKLFVDILPSSINLKGDEWLLSSARNLIFQKNKIDIKDLQFANGTQKIIINTNQIGEENNAEIMANEIDLERISAYVGYKNSIYKGRVKGNINIDNFLVKPFIRAQIENTSLFRMNDDTLGNFNIVLDYDIEKQALEIKKPSFLAFDESRLDLLGGLNVKENLIDITANFNQTPINFLSQYIGEFIDNLKGNATGKIVVNGALDKPDLNGDIEVDNGKMKVLFNGVSYALDKLKIHANSNRINIEPTILRDERSGSEQGSALLKGYVSHNNFDNIKFFIDIDSKNILGLNKTAWDYDIFYGYIPTELSMKVRGALDDINMKIDAKPLKNSKFYMPISSSSDASSYDYITFVDVGKFQTETKKKSSNYFKVEMNIDATPNIQANIILDQSTGEEISAFGNGKLKLIVDLGNSVEMYNSYVISEGKYKLNLKGLIARDFDIENGSSISWSGDPYNANMDVTAVYKLKTNLYPLISAEANSGAISDADIYSSKQNYTTNVSLNLRGPLSTPEKISFDISQPDNKNIGSAAVNKLEQIQLDENELVSQAGMLLFTGQFKSPENGASAGNILSSTGLSTASDLLGASLSPLLNSAFNKITGLQNISLNVSYKNYNVISAENENRNTANANITGSFFKDRVILDFGNSVDFSANRSAQNSSNFTYAGDFKAQYLITEDGRMRFNAFRVSNFDFVDNRPVVRGGIGFSYRKSFNNFKELFVKPIPRKYLLEIPKKEIDTLSLGILSNFPFAMMY